MSGTPGEASYTSFDDFASAMGRQAPPAGRPVVCIQGLGFVGTAVALAVSTAREPDGSPSFNVVGLDLPDVGGIAKVNAINESRLPLVSTDEKLQDALEQAQEEGNLLATVDERVLAFASVAVVCVPLDIYHVGGGKETLGYTHLEAAVETLARRMPPGSLIVIGTTVPPGTCEKVVAPALTAGLVERGLPADAITLAHSPERVTPGDGYLDSIVNASHCYAGLTVEAADACEAFLSKFVNVEAHPLVRLPSPRASETMKVLENSYRATTIAFIEEWARFAEAVDIDLFQVIEAIRLRATHSNMREPGFGVGGYCLTKDPLLAEVAARELFELDDMKFPFSRQAVAINDAMPLVSFTKLAAAFGGDLDGRRILLMGITYRAGIGDTRRSPSEIMVRELETAGAQVLCHDPLLPYWDELEREVLTQLPPAEGIDAIVLAVRHPPYRELDFDAWLDGTQLTVLDACNVLRQEQRASLRQRGCRVVSIGRGAEEAWERH